MIRRFALLLFLLVLACPVRAQWATIGTFDAPVTAIYFFVDLGFPSTGFVGLSNGEVWKTGDGGNTWIQTQIQAHGPISSFTFKSVSEGWLSTREDNVASNVYSTVDAGVSWKGLAVNRERPCVYYQALRDVVYATSLTLPAIESHDGGLTWVPFAPAGLNSIDFSDQNFGILTPYQGFAQATYDGGFTWQSLKFGVEAWKPLAVKTHDHFVFVISESSHMVYRSSNGGGSWQVMSTLPAVPTGTIEGTCEQLYVQTDRGVYVSADEAVSWTSLGGPGNQTDSRFAVVGTTIFAGDLHGSLFRYNDQSREFVGRIRIATSAGSNIAVISSQACKPDTTRFELTANNLCLPTRIDSIQFRSTQNLRVGVLPILPQSIPNDSVYHFKVAYSPNGGNPDSLTLHVFFTENGAPFDTVLTVIAQATPQLQLSTDVLSVDLHARVTCARVSGKFSLINGKCDSVTVDSVRAVDTTEFSGSLVRLPYGLSPRGAATITVTGKANSRGVTSTLLNIYVHIRGVKFVYTMPVSILVDAEGTLETDITPTQLSFPGTSICANRQNVFYISNPACLPYTITSIDWLTPSSAYQILSQPSLPRVLASGEQDSVVVLFSPHQIGTSSATLRVGVAADSIKQDTLITITGSGFTISHATLSQTLQQFGTLPICTDSMVTAYIYNSSCDSTQLVEILPPNDGSYVVIEPTGTQWLPAGDSVRIVVMLTPQRGGSHIDSLEFRLRNKGGSEQALDLVLESYVLPKARLIQLSSKSIVDSSFTPCSQKDTSITIKNLGMCDTLTISASDIAGSNWFTSSIASLLPIKLLPGDSITFTVHTTAAPDSSSLGLLHLHGNGFDTTISLFASVHAHTGPALTALKSDTLYLAKRCSAVRGMLHFQDQTCGATTIDSVMIGSASGASKFSLNGLTLPMTLNPGNVIDVPIEFSSDAVGDSSATIQLHTVDGQNSDIVVIQGHVTGARGITTLQTRSTSGAMQWNADVASVTTASIQLRDAVPDTAGLYDIHLRLNFNGNVLTPNTQATVGRNGWSVTNATVGNGTLDLDLTRTTASSIPANGEVAQVLFSCTVGDALTSSLSITNFTLNNGDPDYARCTLTAAVPTDSARISLNPFCGDSLMLHVVQSVSILSDVRIVPNPISGASIAEVRYSLGADATLEYQVFSSMGTELEHLRLGSVRSGAHTIPLTTSKLSRGTYFVLLRTATEHAVLRLIVQ